MCKVNNVSAGIEASQAAEDTGFCKSSICAKSTMSAKLSQHEKINVRNQGSWRLKILKPSTKNGDQYSPLKKTRCNIYQVYRLICFLKTSTIKAVLNLWKRIMSVKRAQLPQQYHRPNWDFDSIHDLWRWLESQVNQVNHLLPRPVNSATSSISLPGDRLELCYSRVCTMQ